MAITPGAGYKVDPNNPKGVVPVDSALASRYIPVENEAAAKARIANQGKPGYDVFGNPVASAPVPAPVAGGPAAPAALSPLEQAQQDYYKTFAPTTVDPAAVREQVRSQMQGQIDSVNALYNNLTATQKDENQNQYNRVRAVNVGAGLSGSDFASANAQETEKKGNAALAALEAERQAKISVVLGNIDARATEQIQTQTQNAKQDMKDYVDYLQTRQTGARDDIKTLAASGVSLDQMDPETYKKLLSQSGYDEFTLRTVYNNARTAATKIDYQWKTVGNKLIGYGVDPLTGQISTLEKELPAEAVVPPNYKPQVLDNGTIVFYPDVMDPAKPVKDQILTYDTGVRKDTRTETQKNDASAQTRLGKATPAMSALRDPQSGYVDPAAYSDMYATYIEQNPGKGKEFLDQFPTTIYIDPTKRYQFSNTGS